MPSYGANLVLNPSAADGVTSWSVTDVDSVAGGTTADAHMFQLNGTTGVMSQTIAGIASTTTIRFGLSAYILDTSVDTLFAFALVRVNYVSGMAKTCYIPCVAAYDKLLTGIVSGNSVYWIRQACIIPLTETEVIDSVDIDIFAADYALATYFYIDDIYVGTEVVPTGYTDEMAVDALEEAWFDAYGVLDLNVYADRMLGAYIADLTVGRIETVNKRQYYLLSNTDNLGYWRGHEQYLEFIDAEYDNDEQQSTDIYDRPLYWRTAPADGSLDLTTDVTDWPAMEYKYIERVKMKLFHEWDAINSVWVPKMLWGAGSGTGDKAKGIIYKDYVNGKNVMHVAYYHSITGVELGFTIDDDGVHGAGLVPGTDLEGNYIQNLYVEEVLPEDAPAKSVHIDIGNPTVDDGETITAETYLTWASPKQQRLTSAVPVYLPDPSTDRNILGAAVNHDGVVMFCFKNRSTGIVPIYVDGSGTIDELAAYYLYPNESVVFRTEPTTATKNWEVV